MQEKKVDVGKRKQGSAAVSTNRHQSNLVRTHMRQQEFFPEAQDNLVYEFRSLQDCGTAVANRGEFTPYTRKTGRIKLSQLAGEWDRCAHGWWTCYKAPSPRSSL